jgi:hypothetical protein
MRFWLDPKPRKAQDLQSFPNRLSKSFIQFSLETFECRPVNAPH